jgi:hypothetical protein
MIILYDYVELYISHREILTDIEKIELFLCLPSVTRHLRRYEVLA